jgi:hypothetical protein
MEARDFYDWDEMNAWEQELEQRIAAQVGELPEFLKKEIWLSEQGIEWALAARDLLSYAFVKGINVDADLVKPAIAFWRGMFFGEFDSLLFAGRWLSPEQIEEIWETKLMPTPTQPAHPEREAALAQPQQELVPA